LRAAGNKTRTAGIDTSQNRQTSGDEVDAMNKKNLSLLLAGIAILPQVGAAAPPCRPILNVTLPIMAPGRYCLVRDLFSPTGAGIVIRADNVTVDFAGYRLSTPSNPDSTAITTGVDASTSQNVSIMNGTLQGYIDGINLGERVAVNNVGNYLVTNMRIDRAVSNRFRAIGIFAEAANFTITHNTITNLTGVEGMGMLLHGTGAAIVSPGRIVITGNRIDRVTAINGNHADGITLDGGAETIVNDNVITEVVSGSATPFPFQRAHGLEIASLAPNSLTELGGNSVRNSITRTNSIGISLNTSGNQIAFVRDSVVSGMSTGLQLGGGCVPFYLYNTVVGASTPYSISGTPTPCSLQSIDPGPGNR
jgi:hypothetical protein